MSDSLVSMWGTGLSWSEARLLPHFFCWSFLLGYSLIHPAISEVQVPLNQPEIGEMVHGLGGCRTRPVNGDLPCRDERTGGRFLLAHRLWAGHPHVQLYQSQ
jgi:hypothetical protein